MEDPVQLSPNERIIVEALATHGSIGATVADLCHDHSMLVQTVSTTMTRLHRWGLVKTTGKRRSRATGTAGKVWQVV
ncbi:hypothetical protein DNX69_00650 [Rhodopseudomonas palustris]|uniref:MarR family transcriptional regulator n=1 Tax=Rhodopseudomonas palustris TaxID=1076 RepID=A0A323UQL9_RHOPL|nr:hypothetical protein DNX69_00650 [Rhodopseudomonas palustris]